MESVSVTLHYFWFHHSYLRNLRMNLVSFKRTDPQITQIYADEASLIDQMPDTWFPYGSV
jgi:hypothetical protein